MPGSGSEHLLQCTLYLGYEWITVHYVFIIDNVFVVVVVAAALAAAAAAAATAIVALLTSLLNKK